MDRGRVEFRVHALKRMFQRQISTAAVLHVLETGTTVEHYPDDLPFPSRLILGWWESRPVHVVIADNTKEGISIVVTVYHPDLEEWEPGFRKRRKP
jgi:arginyl-tRNA--protein-N-Asp/Glu arginylyltransferase